MLTSSFITICTYVFLLTFAILCVNLSTEYIMVTHPSASTNVSKIDKRSNISRKELIAEYIEPSIPVVLTADATRNWKAMGKLTPEFFRTNYAHLTKTIQGVTYSMPEYIDLMLASTPENPAPYPFNFHLRHCPELMDDIKPEIIYGKSDRINHPLLPKFVFRYTQTYEFFLGGNGAGFPYLHVDALFLHTQITQLYGSKEFILYSPDQTPYLYPKADSPKASQVDVFNPDYDRFPLFREATAIRVTVEEGETILFPTRWWHTTRIHEPSISLGRVQLNAANWDDFISDNYEIWKKQLSVFAVLPLIYTKTLGHLMNISERL